MKKSLEYLLFALPIIVLAGISMIAGSPKPARQTSNIMFTVGGGFVQGAAFLTRFKNKIRLDINVSQLAPDDAYSVWWVVFNNPEYCAGDRCTSADLPTDGGDPRVEASIFWATAFVADVYGMATVNTYVSPNRPWGQVLFGPSLQNVEGAEVDVLIQTEDVSKVRWNKTSPDSYDRLVSMTNPVWPIAASLREN